MVRMKISIFTPTNNPQWLAPLHDSIKSQDFFEWVVVPNGGVTIPDFGDDRIKVRPFESDRVGALKRFACEQCTGDILVEVDHDDLLTGNAIAAISAAFADPFIGFVYSNTANFHGDFERHERYNPAHGWRYRPFDYNGHALDETLSFDPCPASVSRIWYAPNHVRAWRREVYFRVGGHNPEQQILDDQDLLCRTYLGTKMRHIDECLYLYRIHGENAWLKHNGAIQNGMMPMYEKYIVPMARRWAVANNLSRVVFENLSILKQLPDSSVGSLEIYDSITAYPDKLAFIKEVYRVMAHGGYVFIQCPSALTQGAFQSPVAMAYYVPNSFRYYTDARFAQFIGTQVRFQELCLYETEPNNDGVGWVHSHLLALKDGERPCGVVSI